MPLIFQSSCIREQHMFQSLKSVLDVQELDMQMMRLMSLKNKLLKKLKQIKSLKQSLEDQKNKKEEQIDNLKKMIRVYEERVEEITARTKQLEAKQSSVKKVEEFNALSQEIASSEREKMDIENQVTQIVDQLVLEEEELAVICESLHSAEQDSQVTEAEIKERILSINAEGRKLQEERTISQEAIDKDLLKTYERLFRNKKDRVIVPIENRTCSGCHIVLTAQHENLVRKGERFVFCEHCSRIHYWQSSEEESTLSGPKRRRRRSTTA